MSKVTRERVEEIRRLTDTLDDGMRRDLLAYINQQDDEIECLDEECRRWQETAGKQDELLRMLSDKGAGKCWCDGARRGIRHDLLCKSIREALGVSDEADH